MASAPLTEGLGIETRPGDECEVVPFQPRPTRTKVSHYRSAEGEAVTAIARMWAPGQSGPQGRCRLCRNCTARDDSCLIQVGVFVPREDAELFALASLPNLRWRGV